MTGDRDQPSKSATRTLAIIHETLPDLTNARDLLDRFHRIIQHRKDDRLEQWIEDAKHGLMKSFASGIVQDQAAAKAALTERWSNGQTEGQNAKLKLVKRHARAHRCRSR
jgi:transposase